MSEFQAFGFGQNDTGISSIAKKFKGEKGVTYRLGFVLWPGMEEGKEFTAGNLTPDEGQDETSLTPKFIAAPRFYVEVSGSSFYCLDKGPEFAKLVGKSSKTAVATLIVVWPLEKGKPTKNSLFGSKPDILPWVFSLDKYEQLKNIHMSGYPMWDWDISATCDDAGFQKFTFLPAKQNIFKEMLKSTSPEGQELAKYIIERVRVLAPKLGRELGMDLTLDQLRERMGLEVSSPVGGASVIESGGVDSLISSMLDD